MRVVHRRCSRHHLNKWPRSGVTSHAGAIHNTHESHNDWAARGDNLKRTLTNPYFRSLLPGWQRGLEQAAAVICDSGTASDLPATTRVIRFQLLSESSLTELRRYEQFIRSPLDV
jgi:hypothetical protein